MTSRKNPEADIIRQKYEGGTKNNDAELLKRKGIKSPCYKTMFAVAIIGKTQRWFRNQEALTRFQESIDEPYTLRYIN